MAKPVIRNSMIYAGAVALAAALTAQPVFADNDDDDINHYRDIKITSTSEYDGSVMVRGTKFPENVCAVVNGVEIYDGVENNGDGTVTVDISGLNLEPGHYEIKIGKVKRDEEKWKCRKKKRYDLVVGAIGPQGAPGIDGTHGKDGASGKDGTNGIDGTHGKDGAPGKDGTPGRDGAPGEVGANGIDATMGPIKIFSAIASGSPGTGPGGQVTNTDGPYRFCALGRVNMHTRPHDPPPGSPTLNCEILPSAGSMWAVSAVADRGTVLCEMYCIK